MRCLPGAELVVGAQVVIEKARDDAQVGAQATCKPDGLQLRLVPVKVVFELFRVDAKAVGKPCGQLHVGERKGKGREGG